MEPTNQVIRLADYKPHPRNYNRHPEAQIKRIQTSLRKFGQVRSVVVWRGQFLAGHGVAEAARGLGWETIRADVLPDDYPEHLALAYVAADNELARQGDPDQAQLAAILDESRQADTELLEAIGYSEQEFAELLRSVGGGGAAVGDGVDAEPQIDRAEELRQKWNTDSGQLWALGDHRLICGDCTDVAVVSKLMGNDKINLAFTSPPYAEQRDYDESSGFRPIPPSEYVDWFAPVSANVKHHLAADGSWFVNIKPAARDLDTDLYVFDLVLAHVRNWGWHFVTEFCWERNGIPKLVKRRFKNQFEPVYQFCISDFKIRPDAVRHASDNVPKPRGKGAGQTSWKKHQGGESIFMSGMQGTPGFEWFGDNIEAGLAYPGNRLPTFAATHTATGHAAAFPVGLPQWFAMAYTDAGDVVYDPFMGSGSTLMAAENTQRRGRGCELSPSYFAIILERWSMATGKTPTLVTNG